MMSEGMQKRVDAMGIWGALLLGILFAVSFCPTSAAWFFGLLALTMGSEAGRSRACWPRSASRCPRRRCQAAHSLAADLRHRHGAAGARGGVPAGLQRQASARPTIYSSKVEWWARMTTGWVFILIGAYFSLKYVFDVASNTVDSEHETLCPAYRDMIEGQQPV